MATDSRSWIWQRRLLSSFIHTTGNTGAAGAGDNAAWRIDQCGCHTDGTLLVGERKDCRREARGSGMEGKMRHQRLAWRILLLCLLLGLPVGCSAGAKQEDIVILYTNDVHCAVDENIGYTGLAAYRKHMEEKTPYVALVDCGDAIQGGTIGMISKGEYPVEIMNRAGYDFAVPGNHEFDYGMERLGELMQSAKAKYLCCNLRYSGDGENVLEAVEPYQMAAYGNTKVAYIGVCTPESITTSTPAYFMDESGQFVYDFYAGEDGQELYSRVQGVVDECRDQGADYIIVLSHLGDDEASAPFRSVDLIANTEGVDVVLDAHAHQVIPCRIIENKNGGEVLLSSTGSGLNYIGQLVITPGGNIVTGLVSDYAETDEEMDTCIWEIQGRFASSMNQLAGHSDVPLQITDDDGIRIVRSRETNIGDFCADAYRIVSGADIAMVNGGGIRADLPAGDISQGDIINVYPFGNTLCVVQASGQEILDALEMANRFVLPEISDGTNAVGENGGFLQVSGITFAVDTSIAPAVVLDDNGMYVSCGDIRRVKDVKVLQSDGSYAPIDPEGAYTLASHNYMIKQGGDGLSMFMDNPLTMDEGMPDYQALLTYMTEELGGSIDDRYREPQGRIRVE